MRWDIDNIWSIILQAETLNFGTNVEVKKDIHLEIRLLFKKFEIRLT